MLFTDFRNICGKRDFFGIQSQSVLVHIQYSIIIYCFYLFKHSQSKLHAQTLYYHHVVQQNYDILGLTHSFGLTKTVTRD